MAFVNADEIARALAEKGARATGMRAGKLMRERLGELIAAGRNVVVETTLATRTYAVRVPAWRQLGYKVTLFYLRLPNAEAAVQRVRKRTQAGGHNIPEDDIRRRFDRSLLYLDTLYKPIVDRWYFWDSLEGSFKLRETWDKTKT